jgi:hypothetical protein
MQINYIKNTLKKYVKGKPALRFVLVHGIKLIRIIFEYISLRNICIVLNKKPIILIQINAYRNIFCGYYDVSPFSPINSNLLLVHATNYSEYTAPSIDKEIDILLYDIEAKKYFILDKTRSWNWQQGARCQWIDGEWVAYNIIFNGEVRAKLKNIVTHEERILPLSLSIAYKNKYIISIDYVSLTKGSEYGYPKLKEVDGHALIKIFNIESDAVDVLFSWDILLDLATQVSSKCHINHILPTTNGDGFIFIFRHWVKGLRYDSLIYYEITSGVLSVIIKNQTVSHYAWRSDDILFAWLIIDSVPGYYFVNIRKMSVTRCLEIGDGHPSLVKGDDFITEIYSGSRLGGDEMTVMIINAVNFKKTELLRISHPTIFDYGNRCDVHLSLSDDKKRFQIDSRHLRGKRTVIIGELDAN